MSTTTLNDGKASTGSRTNPSPLRRRGVIAAVLALCLASACTKNENANPPSAAENGGTTQQQTSAMAVSNTASGTPAASAGAPAGGGPAASLTIGTDGNNLYFNNKSLDVKAGSTVKLTFTNNATADSGLTHNWVLVKPGTAEQVASEGMSAGEGKDWVAPGPNVIAHTKLLKAGASDTVTFTAPPPGDYPYVCTFPGHVATMKGVLHSK